jgi:hypothetical protein
MAQIAPGVGLKMSKLLPAIEMIDLRSVLSLSSWSLCESCKYGNASAKGGLHLSLEEAFVVNTGRPGN